MKAAVFYGKEDIRVETIADITPKAGEVLIQIKACGVCGTDMHIYDGAEGAAKTTPPTILGHEFSGIVQAVGDGVHRVKAGDRVCVDPNDMCGECWYCKQGAGHFCENMIGIGTTINGGFAEFCVVREKQVYTIPDALSFEEAAMAEPIACCLHGMDLTGIRPGETVLIVGGGTIGLIMLQLVKLSGAAMVILAEPIAAKREKAMMLGADIVLDPATENLEDVMAKHSIYAINAAIECVGNVSTMRYAIDHTGKGGTAMLFGLTAPEARMDILPFDLFKNEITVKASFINPYTQTRAIALLGRHKIDVKSLITDIVPLDDINDIFAKKRYQGHGKIIVKP
ncbi:MAG: zinc-dependent alcohol dehydrogenase family protein [Clostridiales bacterium]|nr:zinc-dependent alcohol dehydrogenase family protein [Clostridiales bacterium]